MTHEQNVLPPEVADAMLAFMLRGGTGQVVVHVANGSVQFAQITETVTVAAAARRAMRAERG